MHLPILKPTRDLKSVFPTTTMHRSIQAIRALIRELDRLVIAADLVHAGGRAERLLVADARGAGDVGHERGPQAGWGQVLWPPDEELGAVGLGFDEEGVGVGGGCAGYGVAC